MACMVCRKNNYESGIHVHPGHNFCGCRVQIKVIETICGFASRKVLTCSWCFITFDFCKNLVSLEKTAQFKRERDLNSKDKQNFEAMVRMTSLSVKKLLEKLPNAKD